MGVGCQHLNKKGEKMDKETIIKNLATGSTENTDFFKHLNEGDYAANIATMTARALNGDIHYTTFHLLANDELEIEIESYIDELESGRRTI
tara:strand:- start:1951 stop:2223 length:273 start_codon:yes stop_codon:yes gene_type:complete